MSPPHYHHSHKVDYVNWNRYANTCISIPSIIKVPCKHKVHCQQINGNVEEETPDADHSEVRIDVMVVIRDCLSAIPWFFDGIILSGIAAPIALLDEAIIEETKNDGPPEKEEVTL